MVRRVIIKTSIICIITIFAAVFLSVCENSLDAYIENDELQAQEADILAAPSKNIPGNVITGHEEIILTFDETIDTATLSLTGDLGNKKPATAWTQTAYENDTLSIPYPAGFWPAGSGKTLTISCTGTSGKILSAYSFTFDVFYGTCVDDNGAPANDGSATKPYDTIQAGIDQADSLYVTPTNGIDTADVRVAGGTYASAYNGGAGNPVAAMANGISIYGGYVANFSDRNPSSYITNIEDTSTTGGMSVAPNRAIECGSGFTKATILDGVTVKMGASTTAIDGHNTAIYCSGTESMLTIQNCIITGSTTSVAAGIHVYGIFLYSALVVIQNNTIQPGWNSNGLSSYSYGIYNDTSASTIENNVVYGGNGGAETYAIYCRVSPSPTINSNPKIDCGGNSGTSYGIAIGNSAPDVDGNTFTWDFGSGDMYFFYEFAGSPNSFTNNYFDTYNAAYYRDANPIATINASNWGTETATTVSGGTHILSFWGNTRP